MSSDFCVIQLDGWSEWWEDARRLRIQSYISIVLFFSSAVLSYPIARSVFFLLRRTTPKRWIWPDDARKLMMWQSALLCRSGLLWIALRVSRLSIFLCQWPWWLFGVCLIIWMDAVGNMLREVIVRKGVRGYNADEKPGRLTLLYEGTTLAKLLLLVLIVYTYYFSSFIDEDNSLRLLSSTGFFLAVAMALLPLLRNVMGAHYLFLNNMLRLNTRVTVCGSTQGAISDAPLGFLVVNSADHSKTYIPAGGSVTSATTVFTDRVSVVHINIDLPSHATPKSVRAFVQQLDRLVSEGGDSPSSPRGRDRAGTLRSPRRRGVVATLADGDWRQEKELLERARAHHHIIELSTTRRWCVQFRTFVRGPNEDALEDRRTAFVEGIMQLKEKWMAVHGHHQPARPESQQLQ